MTVYTYFSAPLTYQISTGQPGAISTGTLMSGQSKTWFLKAPIGKIIRLSVSVTILNMNISVIERFEHLRQI